MKGDFSRLTFDPTQHYVSVRAQQGRVTVDADVNELQDVADHLRTSAAADVVGPVGAPAGDPFEVTVDGGIPTVTSGHLWLDGVLVTAEDDHTLDDQPHVPAGVGVVRAGDGSWVALEDATDGRYIAYVDAWRHHLTALDDPAIREVALGGPDTSTREQLVWQVRLLRVGAPGAAVGCADDHPAWDEVSAVPDGSLAVRAEPDDTATTPCLVPADAGFRRLENQLYRIEIHTGGPTGTATWKASRDNGAVERAMVGISGDQLLVSRPGRDAADGFPSGSWVEITDDTHTFAGRPGTLVRVVSADGDAIRIDPVTATGPLSMGDFPLRPRVRRWDTDGPQTVEVGPGDGYLELEDGVQVLFAPGATYRTGDHWTVPARIATGDVEWPRTGSVADAVPPHGVRHHQARLAVLTRIGGVWTLEESCAPTFPPLTALRTIDHVAGDGQEALPDPTATTTLVPLAQPLVVGVAAGSLPAENARVRFEITAGSGELDGRPAGSPVEVLTDADGLASVAWAVDPTTPSQHATARLLAPDDTPIHLPVRFGAELSTATTTAYDPSDCPPLAGTVTVQDAIDRLCEIEGGGCATLTLSPGEGWVDALRQLPAGQDAVVCFRPGLYETAQTVELTGLGDLVLHGGGAASELRGKGIEQVLAVRNARSLQVSDLSVRAGAVGATEQGHEHIGGALTVTDTPVVDIVGVTARSVAGLRRQASCISVRGSRSRPVQVRVRDCDLVVGHRQIGLLLVDCDDAQVSGNRVAVGRKPRQLGLDRLIADAGIRARLVDRLVASVDRSVTPVIRASTVLEIEGWQLGFTSAAPAQEWDGLVAAHPPTAAERRDVAGMRSYLGRLGDVVAERPERLATIGRTVDLVGGRGNARRISAKVVRTLALGEDEPIVRAVTEDGDRVVAAVGRRTVAFDSELDGDTWAALIEAADVDTGTGRAPVDAVAVLREVGDRVLTDEALRTAVPGANAWYRVLVDRNPAVASQGIVVGGEVARAVRLEGNVVDDAVVGLHVGVSHRADDQTPPDVAGRVHVVDNVVRLRLPVERTRGQYGIFLGNTDHGLIAGNDLRVLGTATDDRPYDEGIRVWGHLGALLRVRENVVANATVGIRVEPLDVEKGAHLWSVVDNATPRASTSVQAPSSVQRSNNIS